jgi:hypothetical protein
MSFVESFVHCMSDAGVQVRAESVTDQSHFEPAVRYVASWLGGLEAVTKQAIDAASTNDEVAYLLPDANIAPGLADLMADFDRAVGWPLSTLLQWCEHCATQAATATASGT